MTARVLVIEHETHAGLDLMTADLGLDLQVIRPYLGDQMPDPAAMQAGSGPVAAGLIVLGGSMGALDDDIAPWLPATRRLIVAAVQNQLPTLGICLGAQLIAAACGGIVERGAAGLEVGLTSVTPLPAATADPFFGQLTIDQPVRQYHFDAVTRLPADAELLVTGQRYPHQGFRVGAAAWAVQYHPEVSTAEFEGWVAGGVRAGDLTPDQAEAILGPIRSAAETQRQVAVEHAQAFCTLVTQAADSQSRDSVLAKD